MFKSDENTLILASASPRRNEILKAHGHNPVVIPSGVKEDLPEGAAFTPEETAVFLADTKAADVFKRLTNRDFPGGCTILGVDTIVYKDRIIGKPANEQDALAILRALKNASHEVISGCCLMRATPLRERIVVTAKLLFFDVTIVTFGDYTDEEILDYIHKNPPYDKSGSYAIQSDWSRHVLSVDGDIENVIGLPYKKLSHFL